MSNLISVLLEIIKITVPALIVFLTVYFLLKYFFEEQRAKSLYQLQSKNRDTALPLKIQAYERLIMFCERISIPNLLYRLNTKNLSNAQLQFSLMEAIRQEYEHNLSQQLYTSDKLWEIILLARDDTIKFIQSALTSVENGSTATQLAEKLRRKWNEREKHALDIAKSAIKKEFAQYI